MSPVNQVNALDPRSLEDIKRLSKDNSPQAIKAAAKQFEGLFLQQVMKTMREASPQGGLMDSEQTKTYQSLLDQQMTASIAQGKGVGLADQLAKQLIRGKSDPPSDEEVGRAYSLTEPPVRRNPDGTAKPAVSTLPLTPSSQGISLQPTQMQFKPLPGATGVVPKYMPAPTGITPSGNGVTPVAPDGTSGSSVEPAANQKDFVSRLWPGAVDASRQTGIPAQFMIGQAALETGWGKSELKFPDGRPSFNVFNIKAGKNWAGPTVEVATTEYVNGVPQKEVARFRAYGSYAEAFNDYASLMTGSSRYAGVLNQTDPAGFARSLQSAGYATDPMYAAKLERILQGNSLRQSLIG